MPLIVVLALISIIAIICVGAPFGRPQENAKIGKDIDEKQEKISAATDIAATSIGKNVKATFTVSTGEINIAATDTSKTATISKSNWYTFLKKIVDADGNLNAVKTITFDNEVNAPENSSRLFYPLISSTNHALSELVSINNVNNLNLLDVTNMESMFEECRSLITLGAGLNNGGQSIITMKRMFANCKSLTGVFPNKEKQVFNPVGNCHQRVEFHHSRRSFDRMHGPEDFINIIGGEILILFRFYQKRIKFFQKSVCFVKIHFKHVIHNISTTLSNVLMRLNYIIF